MAALRDRLGRFTARRHWLVIGIWVVLAVDSTIVRMILVPSPMEILGKANWWFPAGLGRVLPKITIE